MGPFVCLVVMFKRVAVVSGVLGTVGMGIGYYRYKQRLLTNASVSAEVFNGSQQEALQPFLEGNADHFKGAHKTLYQYSTCPFCSKLRAFLDYHGVQYDTKEVNPLSKAQIASHGYHKVPQLQVGAEGEGGPIIVDSSEIVKILKPLLDENAPTVSEEEQRWRDWASTTLVWYMVLNTNRTLAESRSGYDYVANIANFSGMDRVVLQLVGGPIMYLVANKVTRPKLIKQAGFDGEDPRAGLYQEVNKWAQEGLGEKTFHGGDKPDLADLDVYGIIQSQRFLPVFGDIRENTDQRITQWIDQMDALMPSHYKY